MKNTKIIATIWPVTESEEQIIALYKAGINTIRFNFSHANHENSKKLADRIKKLNLEWKTNVSLLLDTKWPEIRTGNLEEKFQYKSGDIISMYVDESKRTWNDLFCDYEYLIEDIKIWDIIMVDSGLCRVKVLEKKSDHIRIEILNDSEIGSRRHINLPWVKLKLPGITEKDKTDVLFAIENNYDFIAMSFVRNKENIAELRKLLSENNASHIKIISKVENQEAIDNLEEIIEFSDWVMVARGDLWIEVPIEKLPYYQKQIVEWCKKRWKFYIVATHLLESMIEQPFPTRAEVSDIYNAVLQDSDCLMLSWESAMWKYPIECAQMMTNVIKQAEIDKSKSLDTFSYEWFWKQGNQKKHLMKQAIELWESIWAKALCIYTEYGFLARMWAAYKANIPMFAFTNNQSTANYTNALYNVQWIVLDNFSNNYENNLEESLKFLQNSQNLKSWDKIIVMWDLQKNNQEIPVIKIMEI